MRRGDDCPFALTKSSWHISKHIRLDVFHFVVCNTEYTKHQSRKMPEVVLERIANANGVRARWRWIVGWTGRARRSYPPPSRRSAPRLVARSDCSDAFLTPAPAHGVGGSEGARDYEYEVSCCRKPNPTSIRACLPACLGQPPR